MSASMHEQMRSRSHIRHLPQELLLAIFSILAIDAKPLLRVAGRNPVRMCDVPWLVVPSVCRWWRTTADLCSDLWTVINFFTPESTDMLLDKSGSHLLDLLYCTGQSLRFSSDAAAYFHAIGKHPLLRAKSVKFVSEELSDEDRDTVVAWERLSASSRVLTHILSTPGPQVVSLDLTYNLDFEEMSESVEPRPAPDIDVCHKTMSSSDYPRLRHIRLHNWISITWDDLFLCLPLSSLTLSDGVMFYSLTEFLDMLARLPSLQSLIICDGDDSLFRDSISNMIAIPGACLRHSRNPGSVALPNLKLLKLTISRREQLGLLPWLSVPRAVQLVIERSRTLHPSVKSELNRDVHDFVMRISHVLMEHFKLYGLSQTTHSFYGMEDLTATTSTSTNEICRPVTTLRIRGRHSRSTGHRTIHDHCATVSSGFDLDISMQFYIVTISHIAIKNLVFNLPLILGNEATRLRFLPFPRASQQPAEETLYHANVKDHSVTMTSIGLVHLDRLTAQPAPLPPLNARFPRVSVVDIYGLGFPSLSDPPFATLIEVGLDGLEYRAKCGTLKEVNLCEGYIRKESVEVLNERLRGIVKWDGVVLEVPGS